MISRKVKECITNNIELIKTDSLKKILKEADEAYYTKSTPFLTDNEYEYIKAHVLTIEPDYVGVGHEAVKVDKASVRLPVWMGSMNKVHHPTSQKDVVLSDKLDGVSCLLVNENNVLRLYTRGNGSFGKDVSHLAKHLNRIPSTHTDNFMIRGELIMKKTTFDALKSKESNARNTVSGFVNSKRPNAKYKKKIDFVAYELIQPARKLPVEQFEFMQNHGFTSVYHKHHQQIEPGPIHDALVERKATSDYEIDGIIVTKNVLYTAPTSGNPKHAFAYKHNFEGNAITTNVTKVQWNLSKNGYYKPTVEFEKIVINNVTIRRATGFNGKYIFDNMIGPGAVVKIQRSGDVIPYIAEVVKPAKAPDMPPVYVWSDSGVDIMVVDKKNDQALSKKIFENMLTTLKFDGLGKKTVDKLYENGVRSLKAFYALTVDDLLKVDGFKTKSAEKLYASIQTRRTTITCIEYMVASKSFDEGLGAKVFTRITEKYGDEDVSLRQLTEIGDIGETRAKAYISGLVKFKEFTRDNQLKCGFETKAIDADGVFKNKFIVFTGFRDEALEEYITRNGGAMQSTVNKKTTTLVYKNLEKSSKKIENAQKNPNVEVIQLADFKASNSLVFAKT